MGWGIIDCIHVAQDRYRWLDLVNAVMSLRGKQTAGNLLASCETVSFSKRALLRGVNNTSSLGRLDTPFMLFDL
jgi:hypothetical protein